MGDIHVWEKIDYNLLWKYFYVCMCAHMHRWFYFHLWISISFVTMLWNFTTMCLGLLPSIVSSIHWYSLTLEAHSLHFWDIFFHYVFTFSLLSNIFLDIINNAMKASLIKFHRLSFGTLVTLIWINVNFSRL